MGWLLDQLQGEDAVLLMYLAGELSPVEGEEVRRRLGSESGLRERVESLRRLHDQVMVELETGEPAETFADELRVGRVMRQMRRFQLELAGRPAPVPAAKAGPGWPWWSYGLASAAAGIIIVLGLWGVGVIEFDPAVRSNRGLGELPSQYHYAVDNVPEEEVLAELEHSFDLAPEVEDVVEAMLPELILEEDPLTAPTL